MVRNFFVTIARFVTIIFFNVKIINYNRFKTLKTGCILAPNHTSFWDTIIIPAFSKRLMYMMAKEELFNNKFLSWLFYKLRAFPVKRGKNDLKAIKTSLKLLKEGKSICMFPEGTRKKLGQDLKLKTGAVMLACTAKVPIIPVGISSDFKFRSKVTINYGEPIYFTEYYDKKLSKQDLDDATDKLKQAVDKLIVTNNTDKED
jgi:1-acyl-sn-glycerol-3-phosphate acyltransferase